MRNQECLNAAMPTVSVPTKAWLIGWGFRVSSVREGKGVWPSKWLVAPTLPPDWLSADCAGQTGRVPRS